MTSKDRKTRDAQAVGKITESDTLKTEWELLDRAIEDAQSIDPPPAASGSMADPVAGSGFTRHQSSRENPLGDTTTSPPFEDLSELDEPKDKT